MADEAQDVTVAEETASESSTEVQTGETQEVQDNASTEDTKTVPYDRFREVIESRKELENKIAELESKVSTFTPKAPETPRDPQEEVVKQQLDKYLKELGYVSKQELEQKEADKQLSDTISTLESKYDGKSGLPKFERSRVLKFAQDHLIGDLELAYRSMNEAAIMDARIKEALGKTKGTRSEVSDGSGSSNIGTTDDDLRSAATRGDKEAMKLLIKRSL